MKKMIAALLAAASVCAAAHADVVREGSGARRTTLNAMELKPFPAEVWDKLSDWSGGKALSSADTSGQVVLICTWSGWYQPSTRALALAKRLAETHAKDGLVVVAVHHPDGWADADKPAAAEGAKLFVAHDEKGEFRKAMMVDQDPDFYVIDRAGQLRFADIATESVEEAIKTTLAETPEKAAGLNAELAAAQTKADEEFRRTGSIRQEVDIRSLPDVPFTDPTPEAYASARWPKTASRNSYDDGGVGQTITLPEDGWYPSKPKLKGRAIVVYVFSPYIRQSYEKVIDAMDVLQGREGGNLVVVGSISPARADNSTAADNDPAAVTKIAQNFMSARSLRHSILADGGSSAGFSGSTSLPRAVVASSDGVVRWSGDPRSPSFKAAVEQVLSVDPGIKARRAAEDKFIRDRK